MIQHKNTVWGEEMSTDSSRTCSWIINVVLDLQHKKRRRPVWTWRLCVCVVVFQSRSWRASWRVSSASRVSSCRCCPMEPSVETRTRTATTVSLWVHMFTPGPGVYPTCKNDTTQVSQSTPPVSGCSGASCLSIEDVEDWLHISGCRGSSGSQTICISVKLLSAW